MRFPGDGYISSSRVGDPMTVIGSTLQLTRSTRSGRLYNYCLLDRPQTAGVESTNSFSSGRMSPEGTRRLVFAPSPRRMSWTFVSLEQSTAHQASFAASVGCASSFQRTAVLRPEVEPVGVFYCSSTPRPATFTTIERTFR
jgi:hypothetical protein